MSDRLSQKQQYQWRLQRLSTQMQRIPLLLSAGAEPDKAGHAVLGNPNLVLENQ